MSTHIDGVEITAFLDGALAAKDRARVEAHLSSCADCRGELESLRHLKLALSSAPRKTMPADLALALERRLVSAQPWWAAVSRLPLWVPGGAFAAVGLAVGLWMRSAGGGEIPLEPLIVAHARYSAEALVPQEHLVASTYSEQLIALYGKTADNDLE